MRLLIDAVGATAGGAGLTRVRELVRELPELGPSHQYVFVIRRELGAQVAFSSSAPRANVDLWFPPAAARPLPARLAWSQVVLPGLARRISPDVVFCPFNVVPLFWPPPRPPMAVMVSNLAPFASEVLERCRPPERIRNEVLRRMTSWSIARADLVLLQSRQAPGLIGSTKLAGKAETVPHSLPHVASDVDSDANAAVKPAYFVVVSDLYKFKGIETVVDALAQIPARARPMVHICGRPLEADYVADLVERASRLGVQNSLNLRGHVEHGELTRLLSGACACIAPSRFENLSRVPGEATAAGTAVIASDIPSFREACGTAALFFPVGSHKELAGCMMSLMGDDDLRRRLVDASRRRMAGASQGHASARILDLLEELAGHRPFAKQHAAVATPRA